MRSPAAIWKQNDIPVIFRPGGGRPLMVRVPFRNGNYDWLRGGNLRRPNWNAQYKCWEIPNSWFEMVTRSLLERYSRAFVIQPYREKETCQSVPLRPEENHGSGEDEEPNAEDRRMALDESLPHYRFEVIRRARNSEVVYEKWNREQRRLARR